MKVGLVRHFKVKRGYPEQKFIRQSELFQWVEEYDASDVEPVEVDLGDTQWTRCYASDLPRAVKTAEAIYDGPITKRSEIREVRLYPLFKKTDFKLPFILWPLMIRIAWLFKHKSQLETKVDIERNVASFIDEILSGEGDVLIVSHAGIMGFMQKELFKRGYRGEKNSHADNAKLYVYEK